MPKPPELRQPLILVGLPGAGKSSVGRAVAEALDVGFVDFDVAIEARSGQSVPQLFAEQGEATFRKLERELTVELLEAPPQVWAPGGGWVTAPGALALIAGRACMIHLDVSTAGALARLRQDATIRPLLAVADPAASLDRLVRTRDALYRTAPFRVDTEAHSFQQVVQQVLECARSHHPHL